MSNQSPQATHNIKIISYHDAQAKCSCGWNFARTGTATYQEMIDSHNLSHPKTTQPQ